MNKLAREINELLLNDPIIKEYLELKNNIESDQKLIAIRDELDELRRKVCKNKDMDSKGYYDLLDEYKNDYRIKRYEALQKEIKEYLAEISDILSLN